METTNNKAENTANAPAPLSQLDKIKLMIIRIGDEKWESRNEHLQKLEAQFSSPFVTKDINTRSSVKQIFTQCIMSMPHKVNLYSYLLALLANNDHQYAQEITEAILEQLQIVFVQIADANKTKNIMRLLGNLVSYGLISSSWFCQFLLSILEETVHKNQNVTSRLHSNDLVFEAILASLPQASAKLQKEQSIDFGTVIESLKTIYKQREQTRKIHASIDHECATDLLSKTWDAFISNQGKSFNSDRVLLSPSKALVEDLVSKNQAAFTDLRMLQFSEFKEPAETLESRLDANNRPQRLRQYRSDLILNNSTCQHQISDKFESALAHDIANSMMMTFQESQSMTAQNLLNMYLDEDIRDALPSVILNTILSSVLDLNKRVPDNKKPVFYAVLLNSIINQSDKIESFKKFKEQIEDMLAKTLFKNLSSFQNEAINKLAQFTSFLITQLHKLDLKLVEPMLLKFLENKETELHEKQRTFMNKFFDCLCRLCFSKKVKEQVDDQFHVFFPDESQRGTLQCPNFVYCANQGESESPDIQIIIDSLQAKMPSEKVIEMIMGSSQVQGTTQLEASKEEANQMFLEVVLWRTSKSLEHLKSFIERYKAVFEAILSDEQSQEALLAQITNIWSKSPNKVLNTVDKLGQLGIIQSNAALKWSIASLKNKLSAKESIGEDTLELALIKDILFRQSSKREQVIVQYRQQPPVQAKSEQAQDSKTQPDQSMEVDQEGVQEQKVDGEKPKLTEDDYKQLYKNAIDNEILLFAEVFDNLNSIANSEEHSDNDALRQTLRAIVRDSQTAFLSSSDSDQAEKLARVRTEAFTIQ